MSEDKLKFWDERAHLSDLAGSNDFGIKNFEMSTIEKFIEDGMKVLDLGCGSGTSAFHFARNKDIDITGLDFSSKMIDQANFDMKDRGFDSNKMRFFVEDIKKISDSPHIKNQKYDLVITERVIINLDSWDEQKKAILDIMEFVKKDGRYLMCENLQEGLDNLNKMRNKIDLEPIEKPWHNRYLFKNEIESINEVEIVDSIDFSSTYYFFSRIINAGVASIEKTSPSYDAPVNQLSFDLKDHLDLSNLNIGQTRLWVIKNLEN